MRNTHFIYCTTIFLSVSLLLAVASGLTAAGHNQANPDESELKVDGNTAPSKPIIIWYSRQWGWDRHRPLELAVTSGKFSHVLLTALHEYDVPDYWNNPEFRPRFKRALKLCRDNGVEIIWTRYLYPGHKLGDFTVKDAVGPDYYIDQITKLKREAKRAGIKLVAFDLEPIGKCRLNHYRKNSFSKEDFSKLVSAINQAVKVAGKVDYVLNSAAAQERHLYNATVKLGRQIITESTYYDLPIVHKRNPDPNRPYDIFGAYVGVTKRNKKNPHLTLYTAREILARQDLWAHKKGLFIYAGNDAPEVALEFWKIKNISPQY